MQVSQREDLYQRITTKIVDAIEAGAGTHQMPWNPSLCSGSPLQLPHNPIGHYAYHGINILSLWASQQDNAYVSPAWASFKQWQAVGAQVRKGEKGTLTVFFKAMDGGTLSPDGDDQEARRRFIAKAAYVFNVAQVDGYVELPPPELTPIERHAAADAFIKSSSAKIFHGNQHACYVPNRDEIYLPSEGAFRDSQSYYGVALHELVHWSGHPDRCARDLSTRFGTEAYAAEELVAELGSAFLSAKIGISPEPRIDHAQYIGTWLKILKDDKRAIFTAAAKANQAVAFLSALAIKVTEPEACGCRS
jgi:antirestriction protein ArdC